MYQTPYKENYKRLYPHLSIHPGTVQYVFLTWRDTSELPCAEMPSSFSLEWSHTFCSWWFLWPTYHMHSHRSVHCRQCLMVKTYPTMFSAFNSVVLGHCTCPPNHNWHVLVQKVQTQFGTLISYLKNSLTPILVLAGIKNYRSVDFYVGILRFFAIFETQHTPQPPPPWWDVCPSYGMD